MKTKKQIKSPSPKIGDLHNLAQYFPELSLSKFSELLLVALCILQARTCNLSKCSDYVNSVNEKFLTDRSAYNKLVKFFSTGKSESILKGIFRLIVMVIYLTEKECILLIDRTNWQLGETKINLLVIGIVYKGVLIPLVWKDLKKKGNSSTLERLELVDKFLIWWQETGLEIPLFHIIGDREFIGIHWLWGLEERSLKYVMRLKSNRKFKVWHKQGIRDKKVRLSVLRRWMNRHNKTLTEVVIGEGLIANIMIFPITDSRGKAEYLYLITNIEDAERVSELYRIRWKIETCFLHLKSNGFNLEEMNLREDYKVNLMMGVVVLLYAISVNTGVLAYEKMEKPIPLKKYKNGKVCLAKSVFRKGLKKLMPQTKSLNYFIEFLWEIIYNKFKALNISTLQVNYISRE